jgi:hypothetical protein
LSTRYILLIDPFETYLAPLANELLVTQQDNTQALWHHMQITRLTLAEVMAL